MGEIKILLGFEVSTGKEVHMGLHHTVITGMTQLSGKTTTLEAIISRANRRAIAFKTKRGESGFNSYREIPPFFKGIDDMGHGGWGNLHERTHLRNFHPSGVSLRHRD